MVSTAEQRRRYRRKYPDKLREQKKRYLDKMFKKKLDDDPEYFIVIEKRLKMLFCKLTKMFFDDVLPKECYVCKSTEDLQIHHIRYCYPVQEKDIVRLCRRCHVLEHQKITPTPFYGETPLFPVELLK